MHPLIRVVRRRKKRVGGVAEWIGHRGRAGRKRAVRFCRMALVGWSWIPVRSASVPWRLGGEVKLRRGSEDIIAGVSAGRNGSGIDRPPSSSSLGVWYDDIVVLSRFSRAVVTVLY
jgi:hypothetical protein